MVNGLELQFFDHEHGRGGGEIEIEETGRPEE